MGRKFEILADNVHLSEDGKSVVIIDQTKLPNILEYLTLSTFLLILNIPLFLFGLKNRV